MVHSPVISHPDQVNFQIEDIEEREPCRSVLMIRPTHFDVLYVINPHMIGNIGKVNKELAMKQWTDLTQTYRRLGLRVNIMEGISGLPDMVFCANQSFPYIEKNGQKAVIESKMASEHRQPEVAPICNWYHQQGFRVIRQVNPPVHFEGMGDAIWHPRRRLLYIGYGYRTDPNALKRAAALLQCPVIALALIDPSFYHLDTALSVLDQNTAIFAPDAFDKNGISLLQKMFKTLIAAPLNEAKKSFVTNGHCPNEKHFIVQKGATTTTAAVEATGFQVIEVDTSEFIKAGGSVFCLKMMLP